MKPAWRALWASIFMVAVSFSLAHADEPKAKPPLLDEARKKADAEYYELYKVFADTLYQVEQNYVSEVNRRELMEAAIRGLLDKLDPYSNYINPDEMSRFKTNVESQFGGIGIQITMDGNQLKVLSPLVGSPAYRAGMQAGDAIVEIEGKTTQGISIDEAVRRLKGEAGTKVALTVTRDRGRVRQALSLEREIIHLETVMGDRRKNDDNWDFMLDAEKKIGLIRITAFSRDTAEEVERALKDLKSQQMRGLVIDLRFNPGGLLKSATDISDLFISEGLIVSTKGRNSVPREVNARKAGTFEGFPIAVLVNRYSASASEIVSACLQDHKRAIVVGERTWGKGSVQNVIDLENGKSALKLTTASYWRPSGKNIHKFPDAKDSDEWGVMPDQGYELKLPDAELSELVRVRRERDLLLVSHAPAVLTKTPAKDDKSTDTKKADDKPPEAKPKADEKKPDAKPSEDSKSSFLDRQLQKALDYLTTEMAKAK